MGSVPAVLDFCALSHDACSVFGNQLLAFFVITGLCLAGVQGEPVPRALPVDPEKINATEKPSPELQPHRELLQNWKDGELFSGEIRKAYLIPLLAQDKAPRESRDVETPLREKSFKYWKTDA